MCVLDSFPEGYYLVRIMFRILPECVEFQATQDPLHCQANLQILRNGSRRHCYQYNR
jgi:hypothetical protein